MLASATVMVAVSSDALDDWLLYTMAARYLLILFYGANL